MKISEIITDKYKLLIPPTVYYDLLADVVEAEEEQEPFINKPCVSSGVCEHDKNKVLDKIRAEILEEKEYAYADFERYKVDYLGQDWEDALDSLPQDDFRYGMERAVEIINKYIAESER